MQFDLKIDQSQWHLKFLPMLVGLHSSVRLELVDLQRISLKQIRFMYIG